MWWSRNACAMRRRVRAAKTSAPKTQACLEPGVSPHTENDSCPIVSEPVHVTFPNDRLPSPVALRSGRPLPIVSQVTCAPDRLQPHKVSASVVA